MSHFYYKHNYVLPGQWVESSNGMVPPHNHPVVGGNDINGEPLYVGRVMHQGDTIPGKVVPSRRVCYVAYGCCEYRYTEYQVLTNPQNANLAWVSAHSGQVPLGALLGGLQLDGTPLYIGRAHYQSSMVIGKVHPSHHTLYVPFGGKEISIKSYEVLVLRDVHTP